MVRTEYLLCKYLVCLQTRCAKHANLALTPSTRYSWSNCRQSVQRLEVGFQYCGALQLCVAKTAPIKTR